MEFNHKQIGTPKFIKEMEEKFKSMGANFSKTKTNGEFLNSMTPEEKAQFLTSTDTCQHCSLFDKCKSELKSEYSCFEGTLEWLNTPHDDGENK